MIILKILLGIVIWFVTVFTIGVGTCLGLRTFFRDYQGGKKIDSKSKK